MPTFANPIQVTPDLIDGFWAHVQKGVGCWLWMGSTRRGYGQFRRHQASRVSFAIHYYDPPADIEVCHTCDNPLCVRPDHLVLGSHAENHRDSVNKGRRINNRGAHLQAAGSDLQEARLRAEMEAVEMYRCGADDFAVSRAVGLSLHAVRCLRVMYQPAKNSS